MSPAIIIRRYLNLILAISIVPIAIAIIYSGVIARDYDLNEIQLTMREELHQLAVQQELFIQDTDFMLFTLTQLSDIREANIEVASKILQSVVEHSQFYENILMTDATGKVLTAARGFEPNVTLGNTSAFSGAYFSQYVEVSDVRHDPFTSSRVLPQSRLLRDLNGNVQLIFFANISANNPFLEFEHLSLLDGSEVSLLDQHGNVVYSYASGGRNKGVESPEAHAVWDHLAGVGETKGSTRLKIYGKEYLAFYERVRVAGMYNQLTLQAFVPLDSIYAQANKNIFYRLGLLALATCAAFIMNWFISRTTLTAPIYRLINSAQAMAAGDLSARIYNTNLQGEIGELANTFNAMAKAIEERNYDLVNSKLTADADNKAKNDFLSRMSHSIRTPMNSILGMSYLALKTELTDKQRGYITKIFGAANSLLGIINDILDFSKIETGSLSIDIRPFSMEDLFISTSSLLQQKADEKGIKLTFVAGHDVPATLLGDQLRLGQVILNIANNALKFTERGRVTVSCSLNYLDLDTRKACLVFHIEDTGIGMTQEQKSKLFTAFTQADGSTTRKFGGTGLGLTITKHIIGLMQGEIAISSEPGKGTTVCFSTLLDLPADYAIDHGTKILKNRRILVVDSIGETGRLMRELLRHLGADAGRVYTASEAFAKLQKHNSANTEKSYEIVILDSSLEDTNVIECIQTINDELALAAVPATVVLADASQKDLSGKARKAGGTGIIYRPFEPNALAQLLALLAPGVNHIFYEQQPNQLRETVHGAEENNDISGLTVLLAEDNPINQQIVIELLESAGATALTADNGQEALDVLRQKAAGTIDIVLMDLEMPVMNGYDASVLIRKLPEHKDIPIIAMTAHAMNEELQKCLEYGMDDRITKPIDVNIFYKTIANWVKEKPASKIANGAANAIPVQAQAAPAASTSAAESSNSKPAATGSREPLPATEVMSAINRLQGLDVKSAIARMAGNVALYKKLLLRFAETSVQMQDEYKEALKNNDNTTAQRVAHTLKGLAASLGADKLSQIAAGLETEHKNAETPLPETVAGFFLCWEAHIEDIQRTLIAPVAAATTVSSAAVNGDATNTLNQLLALAEDADAEALTMLEEQAAVFKRAMTAQQFGNIHSALSSFDFDSAAEVLHRVLGRQKQEQNFRQSRANAAGSDKLESSGDTTGSDAAMRLDGAEGLSSEAAKLAEVIANLKSLMDDYDAETGRVLASNALLLENTFGMAEFKKMQQAVEIYDFDTAVKILTCFIEKNVQLSR